MTHLVPKTELTTGALRTFPGFEAASDEVLNDVLQVGMRMDIPAERVVYAPGDKCLGFPLVLSGRAKVLTVGENGREITLYRMRRGETCMVAMSCILSGRMSPASIVAETDGEVLVLPAETFRSWFEQVPFWRTFVFTQLANRLVDVIEITNDAVFRRLDARIATYLLDAPARVGATLRVTHQDIAAELGSSREVVSRVLKGFEHDGLLRLGRGLIHLEDRNGLAGRAHPADEVEAVQAWAGG